MRGDQTLLLGFAWLWTGALTIPNTRLRSGLYLKRLPGTDALRVLRCTYTDKEIRTFEENTDLLEPERLKTMTMKKIKEIQCQCDYDCKNYNDMR